MRDRARDGAHRALRQTAPVDLAKECEGLSWTRRNARLTCRQCEAETPVIGPDEGIVFTRTLPSVPPVHSRGDWAELSLGHTLHELGPISNICADWGFALSQGLSGRKRVATETRSRLSGDPVAVEFLDAAIETIDAVLALAARYAEATRSLGREDLAAILDRVPAEPPRTFHEALQSLRLLHAVVWLSGHYHVGLGRFDQYMWPYLQADGLGDGEAEELLAEFFISLNKDSDLYPGVQQGDNGQTLTVGGCRPDGNDGANPLTHIVLRVAGDVAMIDPKINLRISRDTPLELLELAAELTKKGLGFPQYSNDDVVIPGLIAHGYEPQDARDYTVAACWEFIIPGRGMEIVNIGAVSFPAAADAAIREGLAAGDDFDGVLARTGRSIEAQVKARADAYADVLLPPAPYYSVLMRGCLERGADLSTGLTYNNFGIHGACAANAADALAATRKFVFEERTVSPDELLRGLADDFEGHEALRRRLMDDGPKVGNNDEAADGILQTLYGLFADACEQYGKTPRGGILRPGTGSAMYYIWLATGHEGMREPVVGATADGRKSGSFFSANLAPSPGVRVRGPISVLQSFGKIDYQRVCNGGPITLELAASVFRDADAVHKTALLVRTFAQLGCQQLQLNSVSVETLLDAQAHPELHRNLIVRVWGWSGYFCELAPEYQEHILRRHMHSMG
jgi:formate C-acetyltransferase